MTRNGIRWLRRRVGRRLAGLVADDAGMSTAEYAIGTVAAAAFAATLYTVLTGDNVVSSLTQIIERALSVNF
jgi:hypothetical protein